MKYIPDNNLRFVATSSEGNKITQVGELRSRYYEVGWLQMLLQGGI